MVHDRVLVSYEATPAGRAALARALAESRTAELIVAVVLPPRERTDVGCARCRWGAAIWNQELDEMAVEALTEAIAFVGSEREAQFTVVRAETAEGLISAARESSADLVVVPAQARLSLSRKLGRDLPARLRASGLEVVVSERPRRRP